MLFNSLEFAVFLQLVFLCYWFVFKRLKWLDVVAQRNGLHAELRQQFQYLPHMLCVFSEVVGSEHLVKKVDVLDHLFPESLRLLLDVDRAIAQVVYVRYDSLHEPRQKLVAQTVVQVVFELVFIVFLLAFGVEAGV